jgi:hypothetical protein
MHFHRELAEHALAHVITWPSNLTADRTRWRGGAG